MMSKPPRPQFPKNNAELIELLGDAIQTAHGELIISVINARDAEAAGKYSRLEIIEPRFWKAAYAAEIYKEWKRYGFSRRDDE